MPFYEYECSNCRFYVEVLQKISEQPLKKCPSCGKSALKKLVSAPVFRLKGSGWYETDFKTDQEGKRNLAGADKEDKEATKPAAEADSKADSKADGKADAKTESKTDEQSSGKTAGEGKGAGEGKAASKPPARSATRGGKKAKSKGAATGKGAGLRRVTSSRSKSSSKRRRGR
jgi:putative FmdB family regulatory protein